jgi:hypothetical protein
LAPGPERDAELGLRRAWQGRPVDMMWNVRERVVRPDWTAHKNFKSKTQKAYDVCNGLFGRGKTACAACRKLDHRFGRSATPLVLIPCDVRTRDTPHASRLPPCGRRSSASPRKRHSSAVEIARPMVSFALTGSEPNRDGKAATTRIRQVGWCGTVRRRTTVRGRRP